MQHMGWTDVLYWYFFKHKYLQTDMRLWKITFQSNHVA